MLALDTYWRNFYKGKNDGWIFKENLTFLSKGKIMTIDCAEFLKRPSDISLGDVTDTWELVRTVDEFGDEQEDVLAVFQTESQIDKHCSDNSINPVDK